jgi:uracil phosphoribosyltransferase
MLNYLLNPQRVRQDHISISRTAGISGHKIGGSVQNSILLFPDPMAATGGTIIQALKLYSDLGRPAKAIAMHCIVTPEYLKFVKSHAPDLIVYALRLDRGLSPPDVLKTKPGTDWDREKGLNSHQYIVPGGGGFGEILNNAYV